MTGLNVGSGWGGCNSSGQDLGTCCRSAGGAGLFDRPQSRKGHCVHFAQSGTRLGLGSVGPHSNSISIGIIIIIISSSSSKSLKRMGVKRHGMRRIAGWEGFCTRMGRRKAGHSDEVWGTREEKIRECYCCR